MISTASCLHHGEAAVVLCVAQWYQTAKSPASSLWFAPPSSCVFPLTLARTGRRNETEFPAMKTAEYLPGIPRQTAAKITQTRYHISQIHVFYRDVTRNLFWGGIKLQYSCSITIRKSFLPHKNLTWTDFGMVYIRDIPPTPIATPWFSTIWCSCFSKSNNTSDYKNSTV